MMKRMFVTTALTGSLILAPMTGCSSLPGGNKEQGAVIGGLGGALAGAAISKNNRGLGALIGGALGATGGYIIGAQKNKVDDEKSREQTRDEAIEASRRAERNPVDPSDVDKATSADLNDDGFVTLDEVVAMERAGIRDDEMVNRLERTGQIFELTEWQENYLRDRGVSTDVVREMRTMNREDLARTASDRDSDRLDRDNFDDRSDRDFDRDRDRSRDRDYDRRYDREAEDLY